MLHRIDIINVNPEKNTDHAICNVYANEAAANACQAPVESYTIELSGNTEKTLTEAGFKMTPYSWAKQA